MKNQPTEAIKQDKLVLLKDNINDNQAIIYRLREVR